MGGLGAQWRRVGGEVTARFEAPSLVEAAALAAQVVEAVPDALVDLRATGARVRLRSEERAAAVSRAAEAAGLRADTVALQRLALVLESPDPAAVVPFWQRALGYDRAADETLVDPLRRSPSLRVRPSDERRPLRQRVHLDVVRPGAAVEQAGLGEATGPYGVCHADADGNEVDLVPGGPLDEGDGVDDWQAVFSAIACYRVTSAAQQRALATQAAQLATDAGFPLLVDLRPGLVVLDSGKDRWEAEAHGLGLDFVELARALQAAAHDLGAVADPCLPRFVQVFLDAADVGAVRAFWAAALGYAPDPREGVTDLVDPRRLNPELVFQELDASDAARRRQRNRLHVELALPADAVQPRLATALASGGRLLDESAGRARVADPEGNELLLVGET